MVRNARKCQFRAKWGGSDAFVAKKSNATLWHEFCTSSARFPPSFVRQPNGPECTQMVRKTHQNISLGSNGVDRVHSLGKIPKRFRGTNFGTSSARFPPSFVRQPNGPEYTHMVQNAPKHQLRVKWGGSGPFVAKNSNTTSWHELLH